jgi:hypothetical protein
LNVNVAVTWSVAVYDVSGLPGAGSFFQSIVKIGGGGAVGPHEKKVKAFPM